ncbi:MAG: SpoIIAA family protein [Gemmataceae bacterium]
MTVSLREEAGGKYVAADLSGKLTAQDYEHFGGEIDRLIQEHGKLRVLCTMHDFHGWTAGALWEDIKFDFKHFNHLEKLALIGETKWEQGMAVFCKPFTTAKIRYFDRAKADEAKAWLESD